MTIGCIPSGPLHPYLTGAFAIFASAQSARAASPPDDETGRHGDRQQQSHRPGKALDDLLSDIRTLKPDDVRPALLIRTAGRASNRPEIRVLIILPHLAPDARPSLLKTPRRDVRVVVHQLGHRAVMEMPTSRTAPVL